MESLKPLLDLQEVDLARDRLQERKETLPERGELADHQARMKEVEGVIDRVREDAEALVREIEKLDQETSVIVDKITSEEKRMYSGEVMNPKELAAMTDEIAMLRRRKAPLEERELELMERREQLASEREALESELADLGREADQVRSRIAAAEAEIDAEVAVEDTKRAALQPQIPDDVLEVYEELRAAKRGIGVGKLENGLCTACREQLSAVEIDRIKRKAREGEYLFRCEHCRRLLVLQ